MVLFKRWVTNFDAGIVNIDDFKSFKCKAKLLGDTDVDGANGILRNARIAESLKYLGNFCRSLEMSFIYCKVELKLKWRNHCVLGSYVTEKGDANSDNIIFTIKCTKLYVPVVILSTKENEELTKLLSEEFERSVYWNEYKTKNGNKNSKMNADIFLNHTL